MQKMKTKDLVTVGVVSVLSAVLSLFEIFRMPQGGSVTLYLVPLFFAAFNEDTRINIFVALITASLQIILGGYILNPLQIILDYYLPLMMISTCQFWPFNKYLNLVFGSFCSMISYVVSGMLFFHTPFVASLIYNATFFIPTLVLNIVVFRLVNPRIVKAVKTNGK